MTSQQGSLDLLQEPVAQQLLHAAIPAHFAYEWTDGTPPVSPSGSTGTVRRSSWGRRWRRRS